MELPKVLQFYKVTFAQEIGLQDAHAESTAKIPPLDWIKHGISL